MSRCMDIIKKYLTNAEFRFWIHSELGFYRSMSDEAYLKKKYRILMGKPLNLDNPVTFNEKLQWLKLHDRNPEYTRLVDKYEVKAYVANLIGEEYVIPTLCVWERFEDIDFDALPDRFVLKCTHDSGGLVIVRDKASFDKNAARKKIERCLRKNYFYTGREWPYKNVPPRILAEQYMEDANGTGLTDYKFFCFDGKADNVMMVVGRDQGKPLYYHFDRNWNLCRFNRLCRSLPEDFTYPKPKGMDEMFALAEKLSEGFCHVRIDLYCIDGRIYFGEYTLYNQSGFESGFDDYSDPYLGSLIHLPEET